MKTVSIAAAITAALLATAATAAPKAAATDAAGLGASAVAGTESATTAAPRDLKRYCFVDEFTGTRIPTKTCRSASDWKARGVDVYAR